jgi:hypothetical protein
MLCDGKHEKISIEETKQKILNSLNSIKRIWVYELLEKHCVDEESAKIWAERYCVEPVRIDIIPIV